MTSTWSVARRKASFAARLALFITLILASGALPHSMHSPTSSSSSSVAARDRRITANAPAASHLRRRQQDVQQQEQVITPARMSIALPAHPTERPPSPHITSLPPRPHSTTTTTTSSASSEPSLSPGRRFAKPLPGFAPIAPIVPIVPTAVVLPGVGPLPPPESHPGGGGGDQPQPQPVPTTRDGVPALPLQPAFPATGGDGDDFSDGRGRPSHRGRVSHAGSSGSSTSGNGSGDVAGTSGQVGADNSEDGQSFNSSVGTSDSQLSPRAARTTILVVAPVSALLIITGLAAFARRRSSARHGSATAAPSVARKKSGKRSRRIFSSGWRALTASSTSLSSKSRPQRVENEHRLSNIPPPLVPLASPDPVATRTGRARTPHLPSIKRSLFGHGPRSSSKKSMRSTSATALVAPTDDNATMTVDDISVAHPAVVCPDSFENDYSPIVQCGSMESHIDLSSPTLEPITAPIQAVVATTTTTTTAAGMSLPPPPTTLPPCYYSGNPVLSSLRRPSRANTTAASRHLRHPPLPVLSSHYDDSQQQQQQDTGSFTVW
ncbi:hypothetical protein RI367_001118 [Sorochytrium milnesiophthora]